MKILIINPNSDQQMGKGILESAEDFAKGRFEVVCENTPGAPAFIETYEDMSKVLNTSEGGLKASYHHAVKKIEKILGES